MPDCPGSKKGTKHILCVQVFYGYFEVALFFLVREAVIMNSLKEVEVNTARDALALLSHMIYKL
jgi:hypothetical protein